MAYLKNLKVSKVSFVSSPANQRAFLLLKSTDGKATKPPVAPEDEEEEKQKDKQKDKHHATGTTCKSQEGTVVRKEIKTKLSEILKTTSDSAQIITLLKSAAELAVTEQELTEVENSLELLAAITPPAETQTSTTVESSVEKTEKEESTVMTYDAQKENELLRAEIAKMREDNERNEITKWVNDNCAFYPGSASDLVNDIITLRKSAPSAAENLKKSAQLASASLEKSALFGEIGATGIVKETAGGDFIPQVLSAINKIKKSEDGTPQKVTPDQIRDIVKNMGPEAYRRYRAEHIQRSKTQVNY